MLWNSFDRDREILENQYSPKKYNENSGLDIKTVLENAKEIDSGILPDAIKRAEIIKCIFTQRVQRSLKELFLSVSRCLCDKAFFANTYNNKVFCSDMRSAKNTLHKASRHFIQRE